MLPLVAATSLACGPVPTNAPHQDTSEIVVNSANNGGTLKAHVNDTIRVTLDTTDWTFQSVSDSSILIPQGGQTVSPAPRGTCLPGMGCGSTTARFKAVAGGRSTITATRMSCGEARRCVGAEGLFQADIIVS